MKLLSTLLIASSSIGSITATVEDVSSPLRGVLNRIYDKDDATATDKDDSVTTVYLVRHAEQETTTTVRGLDDKPSATTAYNLEWLGEPGSSSEYNLSPRDGPVVGQNIDQVCGNTNCAEGLALQGKTRAQLLANWMKVNGIIDKLDAVFSSHKRRAALTVEPTASLAGLVVQQFPTDGQELNPEGNGPSVCPTVASIQALQLGSTALVATHTRTIYQIMGDGTEDCNGLGLDMSDESIFPIDDNGRLPRDQYSNVWEVTIDADGLATLVQRFVLDFVFAETSIKPSNN